MKDKKNGLKKSLKNDATQTISLEPDYEKKIPDDNSSKKHSTHDPSEKYTLREEVGRGGIGRVFVAFDQSIGREIALKELLKKESDTKNIPSTDKINTDRMRFLKEAMVTGQLEHPGIVPVYEIGQKHDGNQYYTMKLVRGMTLSEAIQKGNTLEERLRLLPHFRDICNAVAYAHSKGVVHRDIKPENIMIGEFGETVVIDWGLAKVKGEVDQNEKELRNEITLLVETQQGKTARGKAIGTPAYMSPEQAKGDIQEVDERSDIYSLGAVLYEILTGHPPFEGKNVKETVAMVMSGNLIDISNLEPEAPADLCAVVSKTLTLNKSKRYQTAIEVAKEIENFMSGGKIKAYEYSSWELLKRFTKKNRSLSFVIGILIAVLILGSATILYAYRNSLHNERIAHLNLSMGYLEYAERLLGEKKFGDAKIFSAAALHHNPYNPKSPWSFPEAYLLDNKENAYRHMLSIQSALYLSSVYKNDAFKNDFMIVPFEARNIALSPDGSLIAVSGKRNEVYIYSTQLFHLKAKLRGHSDEITSVRFSPDGRMLATGSWDKTLKIWNIAENRVIRSVPCPNCEVHDLAFSPNGRHIAFGGTDRTVRIIEIDNYSSTAFPLFDTVNTVRSIEWSPEDNIILASDIEGRIYMKEKNSGVQILKGHSEAVISIKFLNDEKHFVSAGYDKKLIIWSVEKRRPEKVLNHWDAFFDMTVSSDGAFIAASTRDGIIKFINLKTMQIFELRGHEGPVHSVAFMPMGDTIISVGEDRIVKSWRTNISKQVYTYTGHTTYIPSIDYSPDNRYIASSGWDSTIRLWDVKSETQISSFGNERIASLAITFSPDGQYLVSGDSDGDISIWNPMNGKKLSVLKGHSDSVTSLAFNSSGKLLFSGSRDRVIGIWDMSKLKVLGTIKKMNTPIHSLSVSPDDKILVTGGRGGELLFIDINSRKKLFEGEGHTKTVQSIAFSPDSKHVLSTGEDGIIIKWCVDKKGRTDILSGHSGPVNMITFSPDGTLFASIGKELIIRDSKTNEKLQIIDLQFNGYSLAFENDGKHLSISDGAVIKRFPLIFNLWKENPLELLYRAQEESGKVLDGFKLVPKQKLYQSDLKKNLESS